MHGVAPVLHLELARAPELEPELARWLELQYESNRRRVERLLRELGAIVDVFGQAELPLMPMKGAVLLSLYFDDPGGRPMNDLDLLLDKEHWEAGHELLGRLGYERTFEGWKHARYVLPGNDRVVDESCEHPDNPRRIELHPRCRERVREQVIDITEAMWSAAEQRAFLGRLAWLPSVGSLWLHLVIHTTHHILLNTFRLVQLLDLERLTPVVEDLAATAGAVDPRAVYPGLRLFDRYFPSERVGALLTDQARRLQPSYVEWADSLNLFNASYLNPAPWRAD